MASNTDRLDLLKKDPVIDGADTFNIETMLNENWQKIDDNVAMVDAEGKVVNKDGTPAGGVTETEFTTHKAERASLTEVGHTQLSNATDSTSDTLAATPSAVKQAYDRADAAFTSASNGKGVVGTAITGVDPSVVIPPDPTYADLANAIEQISTGKKWASGTVTPSPSEFFSNIGGTNVSLRPVVVTGLNFRPNFIILRRYRSGNTDLVVYFSPDSNNPYYTGSTVLSIAIGTDNSPTLSQYLKADVQAAVVDDTSFKIPTSMNVTQVMEWFAFE